MEPRDQQAKAAPSEEQGGPLAAAVVGDESSGWKLHLHYTGLLADFDRVWVRVGERRHGQQWLSPRDVPLERAGSEASYARIAFAPGEPLEAAELAFYSPGEGGEQEHAVWDNAGHPFGFYEIDARSWSIEAR